MVIQLQTSFVQKKPPTLGGAAPRAGFTAHSFTLFALVSLIIFLLNAGLAAAVFIYKGYLVRKLEVMDQQLSEARRQFEPAFVEEVSRLHHRIEASRELLSAHVALSPLFDILEKKTLESVRFRDFNLTTAGDKRIALEMTGEAKSFNAVALQSDVFGEERGFLDPVFGNFNLDEQGDVIFNFKTSISPDLLKYRETVASAPAFSGVAEEGEAEQSFPALRRMRRD